MSNRANRVRVAVVAPTVAAAATLGAVVAAPQAMAAPVVHHPASTSLTRAGQLPAGVRTAASSWVGSATAVRPYSGVYNFGLSSAQAKNVQDWLAYYWGYSGSIDGLLGANSWKAFQRELRTYWGYTGAIDGIPGTNTVKALQRMLKMYWGYTGAIDGIAGSGTQAAFKRFANAA